MAKACNNFCRSHEGVLNSSFDILSFPLKKKKELIISISSGSKYLLSQIMYDAIIIFYSKFSNYHINYILFEL